MVDLTHILNKKSTLALCDEVFVEKQNSENPRPYLGASSIGDKCSRKLWYRFRWCKEVFDATTLKKFRDGHISEDTVIAQLKLNKSLTVIDRENGQQVGFSDIDGHFSGHLDGEIEGLAEAPKTRHVLEIKATAEKKFTELKKHIAALGEKLALRKWNETYYAQIVLYMFYRKLTRSIHVITTAGARDWVSVRTDADNSFAKTLIEKARRIIYATDAPEGLPRDSQDCKYCGLFDVCHNKKLPERNCRTCIHSSPAKDGLWHCAKKEVILLYEDQLAGCANHLYLPNFVNGEIKDVADRCITYKMKNGTEWVDGRP